MIRNSREWDREGHEALVEQAEDLERAKRAAWRDGFLLGLLVGATAITAAVIAVYWR
jgi:hypothetical protein